MQLINLKSNESLSKYHDSPKRTLPVQFSYYLLVFILPQGPGICQLMCPPPLGNLPVSLKKNANAWGLAQGEWALVVDCIMA